MPEFRVLKTPGAILPKELQVEWDDPRRPEYVGMTWSARWRCLAGRVGDPIIDHPPYLMTRRAREEQGRGCPLCAKKATADAQQAKILRAATTARATTPKTPQAAPQGATAAKSCSAPTPPIQAPPSAAQAQGGPSDDTTSKACQAPTFRASGITPQTLRHPAPLGGKVVKRTLLDVLRVLDENRGAFRLHLPTLNKTYRQRGLKKVPGRWVANPDRTQKDLATRGESYGIIPPLCRVEPTRAGTAGGDGWVDLVSVEQNDAEATVNLTVSQPVRLIKARQILPTGRNPSGTEEMVVTEIAGVSVEGLRQYRSYTLVSDGELNVDKLPLKLARKLDGKTLAALLPMGVTIAPASTFDLDLAKYPLLRGDEPARPSKAVVESVLKLSVVTRLLAASLKTEVARGADGATQYTAEQVQALREHHVTPALYFSPPMANADGPDLKAAQAAGRVDARVRYRVTFGCDGVLSPDDLYSSTEYVRRRFEVVEDKTVLLTDGRATPTVDDLFAGKLSVRSSLGRTTLNAVDELMMPVYSLTSVTEEFPSDQRKNALDQQSSDLELVRAQLREAVFYVGASGSVPESWGAALTADELEKKDPRYKVPKKQRDGRFYLFDGVVAAVYAEEVLYSVESKS